MSLKKLEQSDSISSRMKNMWANMPLEKRKEINEKISKSFTDEVKLKNWLERKKSCAKKAVEQFNAFYSNYNLK